MPRGISEFKVIGLGVFYITNILFSGLDKKIYFSLMESLSELSRRAYTRFIPLCENDLPGMRRQYYGLVSCFRGFTISHDCAKYMSLQVCKLMAFFHHKLSFILSRFEKYDAEDTRHFILSLDMAFGILFRELNVALNEFYVPSLHSVLMDFDLDPSEYDGFQFKPLLDCDVTPHNFLLLVFDNPPLCSFNMRDLLLAKTRRIVNSLNRLLQARLMFSECYHNDLDLYYSLRSELRNLTSLVNQNQPLSNLRLDLVNRIRAILDSLSADHHLWVHNDDSADGDSEDYDSTCSESDAC